MQSSNIKLLEEFEKEMWLYIEESLPEDRMKFWNEHLRESSELRQVLDESLKVLSLYDESSKYELSDSTYNEMVETAVSKQNGFIIFLKEKYCKLFGPVITDYRLALGAAIIFVVTLLTFIIENPNNNNIQMNTPLDWKGNDLTSKLDEMDNSIDIMKTETGMEYQMYRFSKDKFDLAIQSIGDRINKLKDSMKNESL